MDLVPDPVWPVLVLATIQCIDGLMCVGPVPFIRACFEAVGFPRRWWWTAPLVKFAATAGLVGGIWLPTLGMVTGLALVLYFLVAIVMHVRANDFGRNLFVNATGMLILCSVVTAVSFG